MYVCVLYYTHKKASSENIYFLILQQKQEAALLVNQVIKLFKDNERRNNFLKNQSPKTKLWKPWQDDELDGARKGKSVCG